MIEYGKLPTEQENPASKRLDVLPIESVIDLMNSENAKLPKVIERQKKNIARGIRMIVQSLKSGGRIFFVGAGTSGRLGVLESAELPPTFGTPPALAQAVMAGGRASVFRSKEGAEDDAKKSAQAVRARVRSGDIVIGIAASGVTPFVRGAMIQSKKMKAKTLFVTCNPKTPTGKLAEVVIALDAGPEIIAGSTRLKSGTVTKMVLNMLSTISMIHLGKVYGNKMVDLQPRSLKLKERGIRLVQELCGVSRPRAIRALVNARWNVKTAILMTKRNLTYPQARQKLNINQEFLGKSLES